MFGGCRAFLDHFSQGRNTDEYVPFKIRVSGNFLGSVVFLLASDW